MMKIRWLPALLILVVVAVTIRLGFWQRERAHQKEALQASIERYEQAAVSYTHLTLPTILLV